MYTHRALFHNGDDELVAALLPFVNEGIEAGERVVVAVSASVLDLLRRQLPLAAQVDLWDSTDVYTYPVRTLAAYVDTVRAGTATGHRMRVAGQPIWEGLSSVTIDEWTSVEAACNIVFADSPLLMLCPYDISRLDDSVLEAARRTHPEIHDGTDVASSPQFAPFDHQSAVRSTQLPRRPVSEQVWVFSPSELAAVNAFVERFAQSQAMAADRTTDLKVCLEELLTQAVDYRSGPARVHMWTTEDELVLEIDSGGTLASPFSGYLPTSSPGPDRGLWLAAQHCDLIAVRQYDNLLTVRVHIADYLVPHRPECDGIDTLLGVYVIGACDPEEATIVAAHLDTCRHCRGEAARLGDAVSAMDRLASRTID